MTPEKLFAMLGPAQAKKGYFFNMDQKMVMDLLAALLETKANYGYMVCPCRLPSGDRELDKDITCPCVYREEDVREFGACFCGLYVSSDWNEGRIEHQVVPERRPLEKMFAGLD